METQILDCVNNYLGTEEAFLSVIVYQTSEQKNRSKYWIKDSLPSACWLSSSESKEDIFRILLSSKGGRSYPTAGILRYQMDCLGEYINTRWHEDP